MRCDAINAAGRSVGLTRFVAAVVLRRLRGGALLILMSATEIGTVVTVAAAMASAPPMSEAVLTAIALIVAVRSRILLRLSAAGNECGKAADILLPAVLSALARLLVWLSLILRRTVVHLLVTWRKWLCVARQIGLLLRFARPVAGFILPHERLRIVVAVIETFVVALLLSAWRSLLRLLVVVRILLTELLLRRGDKTEIMFGMLVVIFRSHRVAGSLRVARKLDVFFRYMRSCAADFDVRPV